MWEGIFGSFFGSRKPIDPEYVTAQRIVGPARIQLFQEIIEQGKTLDGQVDSNRLLEGLGLGALGIFLKTSLLEYLKQPDCKISVEKLALAAARCQGKDTEQDEFAFHLIAGGQGASHSVGINFEGFKSAASAVLTWQLGHSTGKGQLEQFAEALARGAFREAHLTEHGQLSLAAYHAWSKKLPLLTKALVSLLAPPLTGDNNSKKKAADIVDRMAASVEASTRTPNLPQRVSPSGGPAPSGTLVSDVWAAAICSWLPPQETATWELLYSSTSHGKSFSTFMARVAGKGRTVVLIKDKGGAVFGGYASEAWEKQGKFYGNFSDRIFSLLPSLTVYPPSGVNQNFQFCGQGFARVPNGFGWGGQEGYFGLFVDGTLDTGMSRPSATYANPCLASSEVFAVDELECWLVEQPVEEEDQPSARGGHKSGSVLDRTEDRTFLSLAGKGAEASAGYRNAGPPEAEL
eukprot:jgi/Botrbrau1/6931/Bobra.0215s0010.1